MVPLTLFLLAFLPWWAYRVGPRAPKVSARLGLLGASALPFVAPSNDGVLQMFLTTWAVIFAAKAWERAHGNVLDERMMETPARFIVWWFVPLDTRVVEHRRLVLAQREAGMRLRRAAAKLIVAGLLVGFNRVLMLDWTTPLATAAWAMTLLYTCISGGADAVTGLAILAGFRVSEPFCAPYLARSPRDFWSRRWNRFISEFARRNVYWRWNGRRNPLLATAVVFCMSGLLHEYIIIALLRGPGSHTGWSLGFFALHWVAMALDERFRIFGKFRIKVAIAAQLALLWLTSPMFFVPLDEAAQFTRWGRTAGGTTSSSSCP